MWCWSFLVVITLWYCLFVKQATKLKGENNSSKPEKYPKTTSQTRSQKRSEQVSNASLSLCLLLAFPFREASPADFIISTVHTPLLCHNKQVLCSFDFKSSCSSRFQLEKVSSEGAGKTGKAKISLWWTMSGLYQTVFPQAFSPQMFLESSASSVCICRELIRLLGPQQWKVGSCGH